MYVGDDVTTLDRVAAGADVACGFLSKQAIVHTVEGTTYRIAIIGIVDPGFFSTQGDFRLQVRGLVANDLFARADDLGTALPSSATGNLLGATLEQGEPAHSPYAAAVASVWYRWSATSNAVVTVEACGAELLRPPLAVYTGSTISSFTQVAAAYQGVQCTPVAFKAAAGTTYSIVVQTFSHQDEFALNVRTATSPANDDMGAAIELSGALPLTVTGSTLEATTEVGEPVHSASVGGASIWYRWTPTENAFVGLDVCDSGIFDSIIGVYTGTDVATLDEIASNEDSCGFRSLVTFFAQAGTEYRIAVDGYGGQQGPIQLRLIHAEHPGNDDFTNAQEIRGPLPVEIPGSTYEATLEDGEPQPSAGTNLSTWYRWMRRHPTRPRRHRHLRQRHLHHRHRLRLASGHQTILHSAMSSRSSPATSRARTGADVTLDAVSGATYWIALTNAAAANSGTSGPQGDTVLRIRPVSRPINDAFAAAVSISPMVTVAASTVDATREEAESLAIGGLASGSIWYEFTPERSGRFQIAHGIDGSPTGQHATMWRGSDLGSLQQVPMTFYDFGFGGLWDVVLEAETTYRIAFVNQPGFAGCGLRVHAVRLRHRPPERRLRRRHRPGRSVADQCGRHDPGRRCRAGRTRAGEPRERLVPLDTDDHGPCPDRHCRRGFAGRGVHRRRARRLTARRRVGPDRAPCRRSRLHCCRGHDVRHRGG